MNLDSENLVTISEASQVGYALFRQSDDSDVDAAASRILAKHIRAFEALAK